MFLDSSLLGFPNLVPFALRVALQIPPSIRETEVMRLERNRPSCGRSQEHVVRLLLTSEQVILAQTPHIGIIGHMAT